MLVHHSSTVVCAFDDIRRGRKRNADPIRRAAFGASAILLACSLSALGQRPQGWDASHWDGDLTLSQWQQAYAGGFVFCFTKATDGTWYIDPTMAPNMDNGKAAGLYMGVFHFCHPDTYTALDEANYFVAHAGQYMTAGYLRPVLDLEDGYTLGATALSNWVNTFLDRVETLTGVEPLIYTNTDYATHYLNSTVADRDLWIAQYLYDPDPQHDQPSIGVFATWRFWQWSDAGSVPGFGLKDADVFNGTMLQLYSFVIGGGAEPPSVVVHPTDTSVPTAGTGTFTVTAGGTAPLNYRWQKNSVDLANGGHYSGGTTNTLQVSNVDANDVAAYRCVVTNSYGSATSNAAALIIGAAPTTYIVESRSGGQNFASYSETGTWNDGTSKSTAAGCSPSIGHRWCTINSAVPAATATYRFRPSVAGAYEIFTTDVNTYNSGQPLIHKVSHAGGTTNVGVCQNNPCSPNPINTWYSLGQFTLNAGNEYSVILDASIAAGSAPLNNAGRSDAIKWERITAGTAPSVTQHPVSASVAPGGTASFAITASGDAPLAYQWQKNSANLSDGGHYSGTTTASLTITSADSNDAADYRCAVTNGSGTTISNSATLTVISCSAPVLANGTFEGGSTGGVATGWTGYQRAPNPTTAWSIQTASPPTGGGLQYQQIANTSSTGGGGIRQDVTGCTVGATYTIAGWMRTNSGSATCTVKCSPTASTSWATAIDLTPPQTTTSSTWVQFSGTVVATGTAMTIWLDGQTGGTGLNKASCFDSVTVTGCSLPAVPSITQHPASLSLCTGGSATFSVTASSDGPPSYQWQKNQANISDGGHYSGTTTSTLTITGVDSTDATAYRCVVSNGGGSTTSNAASLTLKTATSLSQQPSSQTIAEGQPAAFTVSAAGDGTLSYQWQKNGVNVTNDGHSSGATTGTLSISACGPTDAGGYRCIVTGGCGSVTSTAAQLTITIMARPGDFDHDADVDAADFLLFQPCVSGPAIPEASGCEAADLDQDHDVDQSDFGLFQRCYSGESVPGDVNCAG